MKDGQMLLAYPFKMSLGRSRNRRFKVPFSDGDALEAENTKILCLEGPTGCPAGVRN